MKNILSKGKKIGSLLKQTFKQWTTRDPFNTSNIIAYYTIFSLPGLFFIVVNLAGYFFGKDAVTHRITKQIGGIVGQDSAKDIEIIISNVNHSNGITLSSLIGLIVLLFGATGVFAQMQQILNKIWEVQPKPKQKIWSVVRDRIFSFGLILVIAFLLLVSLILSATLGFMSEWVAVHISEYLLIAFQLLDIMISIAVITFLFASIYKFLPDVHIKWPDVWLGAFFTAVLFVIAKFTLGIYFGHSNPASAYGAAGSIILIMLWVSYASLIFLFGAEFTKVYATRKGEKIAPVEGAMLIKDNK